MRPHGDSALDAAFQQFRCAYPAFDGTSKLDLLRAREYARLDRHGQVYLDFTGAALPAESQLRAHMELLAAQVLGNPHSKNLSSQAAGALVERARARVLAFFGASPD